ncbi:MAG: CRTAC1 family protein [Planctomycetota bacterium]|nr:CRTAC1 family protein [Planctomycetota bacterium]
MNRVAYRIAEKDYMGQGASIRKLRIRNSPAPHVVVLLILSLCVAGTACDRADQADRADGSAEKRVADPHPWFVDITEATGLDFRHESGARGNRRFPEIMLSGAALFDYDNDGDLDIYLTNGSHAIEGGTESEETVNRLFRQEIDGRFTDVTQDAGIGDPHYGMGATVGDMDNDGDRDVYLTNLGPDRLYVNLGNGRFVDATDQAGIRVDGWSSSASFVDYDGDGFLDIYVARYVKYEPGIRCTDEVGRPDYCGPSSYRGVSDVLLHNNGDGSFADVSVSSGIGQVASRGLGVVCQDLDDDGRPDIYVANDGEPNFLWINMGDGTFKESALLMGAAVNAGGAPEAGMGVVAADFDGDCLLDLFVTHMVRESNTLYRNLGGNRGFNDVSGVCGHGGSSLVFTGFGVCAFDVELDGDLDLVIANGAVLRGPLRPSRDVAAPWNLYAEPNLFYLNDGSGNFSAAAELAGPFCPRVEVSRGLASGDIDADGDVDFVVSNIQGPARLYRNDAPRKGRWLTVRAVEPKLNRDSIGASITVICGDRRMVRTISAGSSYLSCSDASAHFGLGPARRIDRIIVRWPDGVREFFTGIDLDRVVVLQRGSGEPES